MIYIYDILLNFNNTFYEFFEWEKNDKIYHIKKIPVFKVNSSFLDALFFNKIKLTKEFASSIFNKTEVFEYKKIKYLKYACIFTDSYRVLAIELDDNYNVLNMSDLLLEEGIETISIANRTKVLEIAYTITGSRLKSYFLTRKEVKMKNYILNELKKIYKFKEISKLKYLYLEYFNTNCEDLEKGYLEFLKSFENGFNEQHISLYKLLKLCNEKETSNLTN